MVTSRDIVGCARHLPYQSNASLLRKRLFWVVTVLYHNTLKLTFSKLHNILCWFNPIKSWIDFHTRWNIWKFKESWWNQELAWKATLEMIETHMPVDPAHRKFRNSRVPSHNPPISPDSTQSWAPFLRSSFWLVFLYNLSSTCLTRHILSGRT